MSPETQLTPLSRPGFWSDSSFIRLLHNDFQLKHHRKFFFVSVFVLNASDEKRTASKAELGPRRPWTADCGLRTVDSGLGRPRAPIPAYSGGVYLVVIRHSSFDVQRSMFDVERHPHPPYLPRQWIYRR